MATTTSSIEQKITNDKARSSASQQTNVGRFFDYRWAVAGTVLVLALAMLARWYQGWASWEYGTEATAPEFQVYWMNLMYAQLVVCSIAFFASLTYLWRTRDRHLDKLAPAEEMLRYSRLLGMLFVYAFTFVFAGSFFAEQDASWHQVVMRDTSFTPSHIVLFYGFFPLFITFGFCSYAYAMTRLPLYAKGVSMAMLITVIGPMMVFPNVGYNEWGHAFWFMEEYFTAPLHWGFVVFGWSVMALGGVLVTVVSRLSVLMPQVFLSKQA